MQSVEQICEQLGSGDQAQAYRARQALWSIAAAARAPGQEDQRSGLAAELAQAHQARNAEGTAPRYSAPVRNELAQALSLVGGDMEVPALKEALGDFSTREMARWALDRITSQAATDALVEAAVGAVGTEFRVGAIGALAHRTASGVLDVLRRCAADADPEVRLAAAEALACCAEPAVDEAISAAALGGDRRAELRVIKARLRLAENLVAAGQQDAGRAIYRSVIEGSAEEPQKHAARAALAQLA